MCKSEKVCKRCANCSKRNKIEGEFMAKRFEQLSPTAGMVQALAKFKEKEKSNEAVAEGV